MARSGFAIWRHRQPWRTCSEYLPVTAIPLGLAAALLLLPLALELYELSPRLLKKGEMRPHSPWLSGVVTASVLLGGFMLRYVVVYAGQMAKIIS